MEGAVGCTSPMSSLQNIQGMRQRLCWCWVLPSVSIDTVHQPSLCLPRAYRCFRKQTGLSRLILVSYVRCNKPTWQCVGDYLSKLCRALTLLGEQSQNRQAPPHHLVSSTKALQLSLASKPKPSVNAANDDDGARAAEPGSSSLRFKVKVWRTVK